MNYPLVAKISIMNKETSCSQCKHEDICIAIIFQCLVTFSIVDKKEPTN